MALRVSSCHYVKLANKSPCPNGKQVGVERAYWNGCEQLFIGPNGTPYNRHNMVPEIDLRCVHTFALSDKPRNTRTTIFSRKIRKCIHSQTSHHLVLVQSLSSPGSTTPRLLSKCKSLLLENHQIYLDLSSMATQTESETTWYSNSGCTQMALHNERFSPP